MKPRQLIRTPILLAAGLFLTFTASMMAQVKTETTATHRAATKTVEVRRGEIVYVGNHELIVKMENGELRHITNIPDSARAMVDGKEIGIADAKVGMKLEKTITTTTTPRMVTKVESVTGTVFHVTPPISVIVTLENGQNQQFKIPEGQKFNVEGQMVDAFGLKKGMKITATRITEIPETVVTQKATLTGQMPTPAPPRADVPILVAAAEPTPAPAAEAGPPAAEAGPAASQAAPVAPEPIPKEQPKTGSYLLIIGLVAALVSVVGLGLRARRNRRA